MTREEKAALRAKSREHRRRPQDEEPQNGDEPRQEERQRKSEPQRDEQAPARREPQHGTPPDEFVEIVDRSRGLLRSLRGVDPESVSGITRTRNGWKVTLEVLELRRIPDSTDVLATYELELDGDGNFLSFEQGRRYHRAQAETGGGR